MRFLFPSLQILMCIGAGAVYLYLGDWRRTIYWFAAATITASVTF